MLFNSIEFALFLPTVFILYWFVFKKRSQQNFLILVVSYIFYGWWNYKLLSLIAISSIADYFLALQMEKKTTKKERKPFLIASLIVNLGMLGFFKYYNFFAESFVDAFSFFGTQLDPWTLQLILPVGISFYTFQTLSYTIDVYRGNLKATKKVVDFFAYVSFFPQLVAGPIERASHLLPQFSKARNFNKNEAVDGMRQVLWGLFKKVVVADTTALYVNYIWTDFETLNSSTILLGAFLFSIQIYGDFSGYSDIAIGISRLFGFDLKKNFNFPYFSKDIAQFHRNWHMSLATWFRDYLYIPLGGSKQGRIISIRNIFIIFIVSGFWHGANWTYIMWGFIHACFFIPMFVTKRNRTHLELTNSNLPSFKDIYSIITTFLMISLPFVVFRSNSIKQAYNLITSIFSETLFTIPQDLPKKAILFSFILFFTEWFFRHAEFGLDLKKYKLNKPIRWVIYSIIVLLILVFGGDSQAFIYFQF